MTRFDPSDPIVRACYARFRHNLRDICQVGLDCSAETILCTVATNVRDWAPFWSQDDRKVSPLLEAEWEHAINEAAQYEETGRLPEALSALERARAIKPGYAQTAFDQGRCLLQLGRTGEAARCFEDAQERDRLQARAGNGINQAIRDVAAELEQTKRVLLVDSRSRIAEASKYGIPGWDMFNDCVHFNMCGAYTLAASVFPEVCLELERRGAKPAAANGAGPISLEECERRLGMSPQIRLRHLESAEPFVQALREFFGKEWRNADREEEIRRLKQTADPAEAELDAYITALAFSPDDPILNARYASTLLSFGRNQEAIEILSRALYSGNFARPYLKLLAHAQFQMGQRDEAAETIESHLRLFPEDPDALALRSQIAGDKSGPTDE